MLYAIYYILLDERPRQTRANVLSAQDIEYYYCYYLHLCDKELMREAAAVEEEAAAAAVAAAHTCDGRNTYGHMSASCLSLTPSDAFRWGSL